MAAVDSLDLRERRRLQTAREISDAALGLFESVGVDGTRIEDIAREAGISPRTFFRYFPTKERAAFCSDPEVEQLVDGMAATLDPGTPLLPQVEAIYAAAMAAYDNGRSPGGRRVLRMWRLVDREPTLRAAGVAYEEERARALAARLREALGTDERDLRPELVVEVVGASARVAFRRWAVLHEAGREADLVTLYQEARDLLRSLPGTPPGA
ncbi:TetR family transcriptional regulator [Conexibacter sp. W3-3-2]|uniref:TetR family transcriptional regulator n=1 Tax=Conexibacter sp. W3-3-2 TaxID=2675227 RepID=UPI0012BA0ACB|nr:TetR family transcriptional regulator [Conexibacter sp. W3-3-2]MTD43223.1 TetR family transcriptional regulator [Conexibacter sp. W3-3-2]